MDHTDDGVIPLTEATFCILLSLAVGPRHGYAVMQDVRTLSDGRVVLSTGTLYSALKRLLEAEWIDRLSDDGAPEATGRNQKVYQLTQTGRRIFDAERARMQTLLQVAHARAAEAL